MFCCIIILKFINQSPCFFQIKILYLLSFDFNTFIMENAFTLNDFASSEPKGQIHENQLVLYNDNVNSFNFVRNLLIKICRHQPDQAEQCTLIVHLKGQCAVKTGSLRQLRPYLRGLIRNGLKVEII